MTVRLYRMCAASLVAAMSLSCLTGCGKKKEEEPAVDMTVTEQETVNITIAQSTDNEYYNQITQGTLDAISDYFTDYDVNLTTELVSEERSADDIVMSAIDSSADAIIANGQATLSAAARDTSTIPVIGTGVIDYQTTLHIANDDWGSKTGTNVTGISSRPPVAGQLSLLIESTDELTSVGILYSPEDSDAIYQNEILEDYLDQAGIPWKEFEIASTESAIMDLEASLETESTGTAIENKKVVMDSSREGRVDDVVTLGEDTLITELNSTNSVRPAKQSSNWEAVETEVPYADLDMESSLEDIVTYACSQCSAFFISSNNMLNDQMETICEVATDCGVTTTGADTSIGQYTLTTLYADPYDIGYRTGRLCYKVLVDGANPATTKITGVDVDDTVKLYQDSVADAFEKSFPKSFTEFDEWMETYVPGTNTTRHTSSED